MKWYTVVVYIVKRDGTHEEFIYSTVLAKNKVEANHIVRQNKLVQEFARQISEDDKEPKLEINLMILVID